MLHSKRTLQMLMIIALLVVPSATAWAATLNDSPSGAGKQLFLPAIQQNGVSTSAPAHATTVPNQLIVKFAGDVHAASADDVLMTYGVATVNTIPQIGAEVLEMPAENVAKVMELLQNSPGIAYVEPNYVADGQFTPNDQYYASNQYGPQIIKANQAWDVTMGNTSVVVAELDTGADFNHPDLQGQLIAGHDYVNNDNDPSDDYGHGTHVAGIIAGHTNNVTGIASVGCNVKVLVMKVLNNQNFGSYSDIAQAIIDATDQGARIINLSLGGTLDSQAMHDAVQYAWNHNVLVVAAAGNNGSSTPFYPAAYSEVMGVTMSNWVDSYVSLSNYGDWVSVAAPGYSIYSTDWNGSSTYASRTGTSQAAPHVAAVAALALSVRDMSNVELRDLIQSTADDKGAAGFDPYYGYGRVNAYAAVLAAQSSQPTPTSQPTATPTNTPAPTQAPTNTPTPPATNTPAPTATNTPAPTATPTAVPTNTPVANSVHIGDLDGSSSKSGKDWMAKVTILVKNDSNAVINGATVSGSWSGGYDGAGNCTTNSSGLCTVSSGRIYRGYSSEIFTVNNVSKSGYTYNSAANTDPDGSSNGTQVEMSKP